MSLLDLPTFGLFYFPDGSVRAENISIIKDVNRAAKVTVTCREDLDLEQGWIEVIWPAKRRPQKESKPVAAKLLFVGGKLKIQVK